MARVPKPADSVLPFAPPDAGLIGVSIVGSGPVAYHSAVDGSEYEDAVDDKGLMKRRRMNRTPNWKLEEKKTFLDLILEFMPHVC